MRLDKEISRTAERQGGVITVRDLARIGISHNESQHRVRTGRWTRIHRGVFLIGGVRMTPHVARWAAVLAVGERAACSHATAAAVWALGVHEDPSMIHILLPRASVVSLKQVVGHRTSALFADDLTRVGGLPVTTVERTIVDTAALLSDRRLGRTIDSALRRRILSLDRLRRCIARLGAAPNRRTSPLHRALAERIPGYRPGDSDFESDVLRMIRGWKFPIPAQSYRLRLSHTDYHLDLAWPDRRVAVELDSWQYHRGRQSFDDDRRRSNLLARNGWTAFRFTPTTPASEIRGLLAEALAKRGLEGLS